MDSQSYDCDNSEVFSHSPLIDRAFFPLPILYTVCIALWVMWTTGFDKEK